MNGKTVAGSPWSKPETVAGFAASAPNPVLIEFAEHERRHRPHLRALDLGCGAGRNAIPLAEQGWAVLGIDQSTPMLSAARARLEAAHFTGRLDLAHAGMDAIPARDGSFDLVVAHGIWNLARSGDEFRQAVRDAARVARRGAALFVFTFSRRTVADAAPIAGESFVFTQFSGEPQCFLTREQLIDELSAAGFQLDPAIPLRELNVPKPGELCATRAPVIFEGAFRRNG